MLQPSVGTLKATTTILRELPQGAWTFMAAALALVGVILSIWVQGRRLTRQFANERVLKDREREMLMRKEIFLSAAEAFQAGLRTLPEYADTTLPIKDSLADFNIKLAAIARLYVVASADTISCVAEAMDGIVTAQLELTLKRVDLEKSVEMLANLDSQIRFAEKERDYVFEMTKAAHYGPGIDELKMQRFLAPYMMQFFNVNNLNERRGKQQSIVNLCSLSILRHANDLNNKLAPLVTASLESFRTELELTSDNNFLQHLLARSNKVRQPLFDELLQRAEDSNKH